MKNAVKWIRRLREIVANYSADQEVAASRVAALEQVLRDRTEVSADVSLNGRDSNTVIVAGRYRNNDYVNIFTIRGEDFSGLIERLRELERYGAVRRLDAPLLFRATWKRESPTHGNEWPPR